MNEIQITCYARVHPQPTSGVSDSTACCAEALEIMLGPVVDVLFHIACDAL